uniref:Uncharacterized protein n=1 Tax=Arundo donax TaxID=35708 RepID=A0A0A9AFD6_ARUDO
MRNHLTIRVRDHICNFSYSPLI